MLKSFEIHCLAPWKAICVKPNGSVVPDIIAKESFGNLAESNLSSILVNDKVISLRSKHLENKFHNSCVNCKLKESSGGKSRRTFFDDVLRPKINNKDKFNLDQKPDIYFLEVNASNKCNLKCRMCNGSVSTSWLSEEKKIKEMGFNGDRGGEHLYKKMNDKTLNGLFDNKENFRNLKYLSLRGGEPFVEDYNFKIMDKLIEWGCSKNIILDVSTNGTVINSKLINYFKSFKEVELYISLEGVGSAYQYIRGGENFSVGILEENIKMLRDVSNVTPIFTITTMIYNIGEIVNIWNWFKGIREPGDEISFSNTVVKPEYLNYQILPKEIKEQFLDNIMASDLPVKEYDTGKRILRDVGIPSIIDGLRKENYYESDKILKLRGLFKSYNDKVDSVRGTKFEDVFPYLTNFYNQIGV